MKKTRFSHTSHVKKSQIFNEGIQSNFGGVFSELVPENEQFPNELALD